MKKSNKEIQNQVNATLEMFKEIEPLKSDPDFYKQTIYKMNTMEKANDRGRFSLKGLLQPLAAGLILALNIYVGILYLNTEETITVNQNSDISSFAQEYMLASNDADWLQVPKGEE